MNWLHMMHMDPVKLRNEHADGRRAPSCISGLYHSAQLHHGSVYEAGKEMMSWDEKYPYKDMGNGKVRGVGVAMAMQGSSIAGIDVGGADMKLNEDGSYTLGLGCTDMGTGCDTIPDR